MDELIKRYMKLEQRLGGLVRSQPLFDVGNEDTPAQFTANQNNLTPGNYDILRLSSDTSRNLTGIADGRKGRILQLVNTGSNDIVIKHQDGSSTDINRFLVSGGTDMTLGAGQRASAYYDSTTQRWRVMYRASVPPATGQVYGSAFSFDSYYLNGAMQLESTYVPTTFTSATLVHTNNTNRRVNKEIMRAGEYLYWMERVGVTWYITEYNITTTAETQIAVSALSNPTSSFWCVTEERIVYYLKIDTSTQNDIYKLDFSAGTNVLFDQFASDLGGYYRSSCVLMSSTYIAAEQYLVICGGISVTYGAYGYKKNLTTGAANVITDTTVASNYTLFLGGQWCGTKVYLTGKPVSLYPAVSNSPILAFCYDVAADSMTSGQVTTLTSKVYSPYYAVANNTDGKMYWYIKQTNDLNEQYFFLFNMDSSGTGGITYQSPDLVSSPKLFGLFQSRTNAYYYLADDNGVDNGAFYNMSGGLVIAAPSDFKTAPFYVGKRDINLDDNNNVWYWVEASNTLKSFNITSGASASYGLSVTDATSTPVNNKMSLLGNYIVFQTYFNSSVNSNIYLLK